MSEGIPEKPPPPVETPGSPVPPPRPASGVAAKPRFSDTNHSGVRFSGVSFDSRSHRLSVVDQTDGPGSEFGDAAAAGRSAGALAAVNAGFFTPEGKPLGLVVAGGRRAGSWNRTSSLGSGVWHDGGPAGAAITRRGDLGPSAALRHTELIQAGPLLVEKGKPVGGLNAGKSAARTVILWDGGTRWWIGRTSSCSLAAAARVLAASGPAGWPVSMALNLDGGRSSELWVSGGVAGGPERQRPAWNRPVRNFLVLLPR